MKNPFTFNHNNLAEVSTSIEINAPIQQVFDFVTNPTEHPKVFPGLVAVKDVPIAPLHEGSQFGYSYQLYGMGFDGAWTVKKIDPPVLYEGESTGEISSYWTYKLTKLNDHTTRISLHVRYLPPKTLFQMVRLDVLNAINQQNAEAFLRNSKSVIEGRQ